MDKAKVLMPLKCFHFFIMSQKQFYMCCPTNQHEFILMKRKGNYLCRLCSCRGQQLEGIEYCAFSLSESEECRTLILIRAFGVCPYEFYISTG